MDYADLEPGEEVIAMASLAVDMGK